MKLHYHNCTDILYLHSQTVTEGELRFFLAGEGHGRIEMCLLYDGFFSFAVVRQISIDTFLKVPLLLLVTLFLLQLLYRYIL